MTAESNGEPKNDAGWFTLPNAITAVRIIGSPVLIVLGLLQLPWWLAILTGILVFTEWLDGFLARQLHVESAMGARLDTIADAIFYTSMLVAVACLVPERLLEEYVWIAIAVLSYLWSWIASWIKFGCLPSYHTWMAKTAWLLVAPGIVLMVLGWDVWLFRFSMVFVLLTNLEAVWITRSLDQVQTDVRSILQLRNRRELN